MKLFKYNIKISFKDFLPPIVMRFYWKISSYKKSLEDADYAANKTARTKFIHGIFGTFDGYSHEDLLLDFLFDFKDDGIYVEIGANDPNIFPSHTSRFYKRGWRGINVEPLKKAFEGLLKARDGDINLNICVGKEKKKTVFYELEGRLNGSSLNKSMVRKSASKDTLIRETEVETIPLREIFEKHLGRKKIDFMSIDVEGFEMEVLLGNDWRKFKPKALIIETLHYGFIEITEFLSKNGYLNVYNNETNSIYINKEDFKEKLKKEESLYVWKENEETIPNKNEQKA
jgi:FkbM family methyltransferase